MPGLYDNSPGLVDDLAKVFPAAAAPAAAPAGAPAAPRPPSAAERFAAAAYLVGGSVPERATPTPELNPRLDRADIPPEVKELRQANHSHIDPAGMLSELNEDLERTLDPMLPTEERAAQVYELKQIAADVGATADDVRTLLAEAHALDTNPPSEEDEQRMQHDCIDALRRVYGVDADAAADDARRLVARDSRLAAYLEATGLGNVPAVVLRFAALARSERSRGRLKST